MAPRQALFDTPLAPYQPVHRCVEFILVDGLQPQDLAEGGDSALRVQGASGGQFGAGVDDAGDNHGDDEIAPATGRTSDEGMQAELLEGAEDGGDMAVGVAAQASEGGLGIDQGFAFESSADEIDDVCACSSAGHHDPVGPALPPPGLFLVKLKSSRNAM